MQSVGDDDCFLTPDVGVVKLKDDPNQLGTEITFTCPEPTCPEPSRRGRRVARIAWHLSYSDLTTPTLFVLKYPQGGSLGFGIRSEYERWHAILAIKVISVPS